MNKYEFLGTAISHMIEHGKSVKLIHRKSVKCDGVATGGFCNENGITMATKQDSWFQLFVHEYCHFLQEIDDDYTENDDDDAWNNYDHWLLGKCELKPEQIKRATKLIRDCEIDCEKRAVELIKKYNLPIDVERYTQEANVYALFYTLVSKYRMWYSGESPCSIKELADLMPTEFKSSWNRVPKKFEEIVKEKCFEMA